MPAARRCRGSHPVLAAMQTHTPYAASDRAACRGPGGPGRACEDHRPRCESCQQAECDEHAAKRSISTRAVQLAALRVDGRRARGADQDLARIVTGPAGLGRWVRAVLDDERVLEPRVAQLAAAEADGPLPVAPDDARVVLGVDGEVVEQLRIRPGDALPEPACREEHRRRRVSQQRASAPSCGHSRQCGQARERAESSGSPGRAFCGAYRRRASRCHQWPQYCRGLAGEKPLDRRCRVRPTSSHPPCPSS